MSKSSSLKSISYSRQRRGLLRIANTEERGDYWSCDQLEQYHWLYLYSQVSLENKLGGISHGVSGGSRDGANRKLLAVRVSFCATFGLAEELVPMTSMSSFYGRHEKHARLPLLYPEARIIKDEVPRFAVEVYGKTFRGEN